MPQGKPPRGTSLSPPAPRRPALTNAAIHYTKYRVGCESAYCFRVKTFSLEGDGGGGEGEGERRVESFNNCSLFLYHCGWDVRMEEKKGVGMMKGREGGEEKEVKERECNGRCK